eukprot:5397252-Heterocapsa_arctica.AAC.1
MGATFATLMYAGWDPTEPTFWMDIEGGNWALDPDTKPTIHTCGPLLDQLRQCMLKSFWGKASNVRNAGGLQNVPNLPFLKTHMEHYTRKGKHAEAG